MRTGDALSHATASSDGVVALRRWGPGDAAAIVRALRSPQVPSLAPWPPEFSTEDARARFQAAAHRAGKGGGIELAVVGAATGDVLGFIGFAPAWPDLRAELFYWTAPWARGGDVTQRALCRAADWAFGEHELVRLELFIDMDNVTSQRIAMRAGFVEEGRLRRYRACGESRRDMVLLAHLRSQEAALRAP